jgi:Tfp pilus assembly protein PilF
VDYVVDVCSFSHLHQKKQKKKKQLFACHPDFDRSQLSPFTKRSFLIFFLFHRHSTAACYEKALLMDADNTAVLDSYASFLFDLDDFDKARSLLERSIKIAPDEHFSKWMQVRKMRKRSNGSTRSAQTHSDVHL